MYYIINKTEDKTYTHEGNFPMDYLDSYLDADNEIIVISLYSNTIKVPHKDNDGDWVWEDYKLPQDIVGRL